MNNTITSGSVNPPPIPQPPNSNDLLYWFVNDFRPHFNKWIFETLDKLVKNGFPLMGFILMACSIDYLASFYYGKSTKGNNKKSYIKFINDYFPPGKYDAFGIYDSLRNGLVHLFTIKGRKYALIHARPDLHLKPDKNKQIILNASDFLDDLHHAAQKYFDDVESNPVLLKNLRNRYDQEGFLDVRTLKI